VCLHYIKVFISLIRLILASAFVWVIHYLLVAKLILPWAAMHRAEINASMPESFLWAVPVACIFEYIICTVGFRIYGDKENVLDWVSLRRRR